MRFTPLVVLLSTAVFTWAAVAETKSTSSRSKADSDEDATPRPKKGATPRAKPKATPSESDDDDAKPKPRSSPVKKKASADSDDETKPSPKATPGIHKAFSDDDGPKPKATPAHKKSTDDDTPAATPHPKTPKTDINEKSDEVKKKEAEATPPVPSATPGGKGAPPASIEATELAKYKEQPERVRELIDSALALSKMGLTYKYGSDDPANGGMDCSGSVSYLLRQQGFKDVPRDASGQYVWARKNGKFFAVISKKAGGFEFDDLRPGDLMFWSGTYSIDRDPPVTHSMIYLGEHKTRKQLVMWGASDGRSYDGKSRYGVGVFDFKMPRAGGEGEGTTAVGNHPDFLGYARIPGLREEGKGSTEATSTTAETKSASASEAKSGAAEEPKARSKGSDEEETKSTPTPAKRGSTSSSSGKSGGSTVRPKK